MQDGTSNNESTLDDSGRIVEQAGNRDSDTSESRQRKSWDTSSIIELLGYIIAGKTNGDIAVLMDSSIHNISNLMSRKGITRGNAKLKLEEYSIADDTQDKKDSTEYNSTPYDKQTTLQPASTVDFSLISSKIRLAKQLADEYCEYKDLISNERDPIKLGRLYQVLIELEEQVREWQ